MITKHVRTIIIRRRSRKTSQVYTTMCSYTANYGRQEWTDEWKASKRHALADVSPSVSKRIVSIRVVARFSRDRAVHSELLQKFRIVESQYVFEKTLDNSLRHDRNPNKMTFMRFVTRCFCRRFPSFFLFRPVVFCY